MPAFLKPTRLLVLAALLLAATTSSALAVSYVQVTSDPGHDRNPTWSADGQYILFDSNRSGGWRVYRMGADGGGVTLLNTGGFDAIQPSISPDGQWVAFTRGPMDPVSGAIDWSQICIMPYPSGPITELTPQNLAHLDQSPSWSADGNTVYFDRRLSGDYHVYSVPAAGGSSTLLISQGQADVHPLQSPDGLWLTYASRSTTSSPLNAWEAPVANLAARTQLTFETKNTAATDYSPDASKLLIGSRKGVGWGDMYEYDRASSVMTRLTFDSDTHTFELAVTGGYYRPGNTDQIVFGSARITGNREIWIYDREAPPVDPNVLRVLDAAGLPGGAPVVVRLEMTNDRPVRGLQFTLADTPDRVSVTGLETTGRALAFQADFNDQGAAQVLVYPSGPGSIGIGTGTILEFSVAVSSSASIGDSIDLDITSVLALDGAGAAFALPVEGGRFVVRRLAGDITGDNEVNGGDLVRLVDIILGRGPSPTADELAAADCDADAVIDLRDILCLQGLIGPESAAITLPIVAEAAQSPIEFELLEPVRAVAFEFAADEPLPVPLDGLAPFATRAWRTQDGVSVLASDYSGGAWPEGRRAALAAEGLPRGVRAWGRDGRELPVRLEEGRFVLGVAAAAPPVPAFSAAPNPFTAATTVRYRLPVAGAVRIDIMDVTGRRIRTWTAERLEAGPGEWTWDGRDERGRDASGGVYFARLTVPGGGETLRLVRIDR